MVLYHLLIYSFYKNVKYIYTVYTFEYLGMTGQKITSIVFLLLAIVISLFLSSYTFLVNKDASGNTVEGMDRNQASTLIPLYDKVLRGIPSYKIPPSTLINLNTVVSSA